MSLRRVKLKSQSHLKIAYSILPDWSYKGFNDWRRHIRNELDRLTGLRRYVNWKRNGVS